MFDLIIIGGGPAGSAAAVYAGRKRLKTLLITKTFGGQSIVSEGIENWIGEIKISGSEIARKLEEHVRAYAGEFLEIIKGEAVDKIEKNNSEFLVKTINGEYKSKAVLVATGSQRKKLEVVGAEKFENKGITYCASCDGPLFSGKEVVVIGGGNSALEAVAQLSSYCKKVYILHRRNEFRGDQITINKVLTLPNVQEILNADILEIQGDQFVKGIKYLDKNSNQEKNLSAEGIFVEIGALPATQFVKNLVEIDELGYIKIDHRTQKTSVAGIWAAGDCTDTLYHQNNIAMGDAVRALEDIYSDLKTK